MTYKAFRLYTWLPVLAVALLGGCATSRSPWMDRKGEGAHKLPPAVLEGVEEDSGEERSTAGVISNDAAVVRLSVEEAVLMALEHNASFRVDRLSPGIVETREREALAAFDPVVSANAYQGDVQVGTNEITGSDAAGAGVGLRKSLATGTTLDAGGTRAPASGSVPPSTSYDVQLTQSLLQGFGPAANLASVRQARLDTLISAYELRGVAEALVAQVEGVYWDHMLAERSIAIYEESLKIAEQQIAEAQKRIRIGSMAETELTAAEAELASRRERLIDARSESAKSRLTLLRLVNQSGGDALGREVELTDLPELSGQEGLDDVRAHVALGLKQRADLNQARLAVTRGEIEVVRTRNGLLPKLDLFIRLGGTRYAEAFSSMSSDEWSREAQAGLLFEYPLGNRAERASHDRAKLSLEQARGSLVNMKQLVEVDIRTAYLEVARAQEQVSATEATRKLREETLQTELEKLRVGKSTSLLVAQASRDSVESRIACVRAVIAYRKALLDLYRLEGSLLERRGIQSATGAAGMQ
ncbi:MAG TPA: TolC family protein [Kiritimatiellia bacterium]|nr:TolC family protein [Kiritimatiellia bacterium]